MGSLTSKETTVAGTSILAAGVPTLFLLTDGEDLTTRLANEVFEGDKGSARLWAGFGFAVCALILGGAAVIGPFNGFRGFASLAAGIASLMLALAVIVEGGR